MDLAALKAEIEQGPLAGALAPLVASGNDAAIARELNTAQGATTVQRRTIPSPELLGSVDRTEFAALPAADRSWLQLLVAAPEVDLAAHRTALGALFPSGSATRAAISAKLARPGTRVEVLFGDGAFVTADDVQRALRPVQAGTDEGAGGRRLEALVDATDPARPRLRIALVNADGSFVEWRSP